MDQKNQINYINTQSKLGWNEYFMLQAIMASFKSKDPNTQVGCVFVDDKNHQLSMGYNGFVAGIDETKLPWGNDRNADFEHQKYGYVVHSEANAILHAKGDLTGSKLYVTLFPCEECSKMLASKKVKEIYYLSDKYNGTPGNIVAKKILDLTGIKYTKLDLKSEILDQFKSHGLKLIQDA